MNASPFLDQQLVSYIHTVHLVHKHTQTDNKQNKQTTSRTNRQNYRGDKKDHFPTVKSVSLAIQELKVLILTAS